MIFKKALFITAALCSFSHMYSMHTEPTIHIKRSKDLPKEPLTHFLKSYDTHLGLYNQLYHQRLHSTPIYRYGVKAPSLTALVAGGVAICCTATQYVTKNCLAHQILASSAKKACVVGFACAAIATIGTFLTNFAAGPRIKETLRDHRQVIANQRAAIIYTYNKRAQRIENFGELQDLIANNEHYGNAKTVETAAALKDRAREQLAIWRQLQQII